MLALAGAAIPAGTQGLPLPFARKARREVFVYEGLEGYGGTKPFLAAISAQWKLIYTWDDAAQVGKSAPSFVELYNRQRDPDEARNLAAETKLQTTRHRLAQVIKKHLAELKRK